MTLKKKKTNAIKHKHNKKRNTAFLYEVLVRELTASIVKEDLEKKKQIISLLKEFFNKNTVLYRELELYKALNETRFNKSESNVAEKLLSEVKKEHEKLGNQEIFLEQTKVLKRINRMLSKNALSCFVPNYKNLATISQFFNKDVSVKEKVLLEQKIASFMVEGLSANKEMKHIDNLSMKTFLNKFNSAYRESLLPEQKELLNYYVLSFSDNGISFKIYLNEELGRLKNKVSLLGEMKEVEKDQLMIEKSEKVLKIINDFKKNPIDMGMTRKILKIQKLVSEIN